MKGIKKLEQSSMQYEILPYPKSLRNTVTIAQYVGVPSEMLFKSLMLRSAKKELFIVMIPSNRKLDLIMLQEFLHCENLQLVTPEEVFKLSGLQVGGVSPLAMDLLKFNLLIDSSVNSRNSIVISAGQCGISVRVDRKEFLSEFKPLIIKY